MKKFLLAALLLLSGSLPAFGATQAVPTAGQPAASSSSQSNTAVTMLNYQTVQLFTFLQAFNPQGTRAAMSGGTYTFTFPKAYTVAPVCVAVSETATGTLHVTSSVTSCIVTSSSGTDTSTVDILAVGNPN